ncbi:hypothetical protein [Streptomyces sp. NPDC088725]|uniref:hypothetical protein n=1 Tax=Streptomyces sp. NPDC088725 TaxID=3365873 RepID=UPI0038146955
MREVGYPAAVRGAGDEVAVLHGIEPPSAPGRFNQKAPAEIDTQSTAAGLTPGQRKGADTCINRRTAKAEFLAHSTTLDVDRPITTDVTEGACRHLIDDRLASPMPDGTSPKPKPSANSAPCTAMSTSARTGHSTSSRDADALPGRTSEQLHTQHLINKSSRRNYTTERV